jgi:hypothetical protein
MCIIWHRQSRQIFLLQDQYIKNIWIRHVWL